MNMPLTVTVDPAKASAKLSGPLVLGNTYQLTFEGLTTDQLEANPTVILLGRPQRMEVDGGGQPTIATNIAAMSDAGLVLAMTTQELVESFSLSAQPPQALVDLSTDARKPTVLSGEVLHGASRPHGALRLHFYVTANGVTLAQGDCTVLWAPFEYDGSGNPVVLQGPKGDKGEQGPQGPQGERGANGVIYTSTGCVTFKVDTDPESDTYGHLLAYADNDYGLYHAGNTGKPHFLIGTGTGDGGNGLAEGHLFYVYYPADPQTATQHLDIGDVRGPQGPADSGAVFAATLESELERNVGQMTAWNLNTAILLANAIKNAIFAATGHVTALLLAFVLPFLFSGMADAGTAATLGEMAPTNTVYTSQQVDTLMEDVGHGDGSLEYVWGPVHFTNQNHFATNFHAKGLGIKPTESNANLRIAYDPETSTYTMQALGGIPGPKGADGIGNVLWAGEFRSGMYITNANTWVTWNGSIWTRAPSAYPIMDPPTNNLTWTRVVSRGSDGASGRDGRDAVGLQFVEWSTNLTVLYPDMLISHGGYLLRIDSDVPIDNPGQPVQNKLPTAGYKVVVPPGADGAAASVFTNASFVFEFDPNTAVNANSLVVYQGYLWYARLDYVPRETPIPVNGSYWACIGKQGDRGPAGANGIGNLRYTGAWDANRTNEVNDIVRWTRADGKVDWYRATGTSVGARPDTAPNYWSKEITSGTDANTVEWKFVDGAYDNTVGHSNELHRMPDGKVWYSVGNVPAGESYTPGRNAESWRLFVKDGTSVASNTVWRGVWNQGIDYDPGDMVTWAHNGGNGLYIKKTAGTNAPYPSDTDHWTAVATGIQGERGPAGANGRDGTATYISVTNITTYSNATIITNIHNITNDSTTAIVNYNLPSEVYHTVKFLDSQFYHNPSRGTFELTESALGVSTFNGWRGGVSLLAGSNITFAANQPGQTITIHANNGMESIPIGITRPGTIDAYDSNDVARLIFDSNTGFRLQTNGNNEMVLSLGSSWTTLYDDVGASNSPTGEEPLRITTHTNDTSVAWAGTTNINGQEVKLLSIGVGAGTDSEGRWVETTNGNWIVMQETGGMGVTVQDSNNNTNGLFTFVFERTNGVAQVTNSYWNGSRKLICEYTGGGDSNIVEVRTVGAYHAQLSSNSFRFHYPVAGIGTWETWTNCSWTATGKTGRVIVNGVRQEWECVRIVDNAKRNNTKPLVVSYAPIYIETAIEKADYYSSGHVSSSYLTKGNRVATMQDVWSSVADGHNADQKAEYAIPTVDCGTFSNTVARADGWVGKRKTVNLTDGWRQAFVQGSCAGGLVCEIALPAADPNKVGHVVFYADMNPSQNFRCDMATNHIAVRSYPARKPWLSGGERSTWEWEFQSLLGSAEWHYLKGTEYITE